MHIKKLIGLALCSLVVAACTNNQALSPNPANQIVGANTGNTGSAQSYAANTGASYQQNAQGFKINAMQAPANQTYYFGFDQSTMRPQDLRALLVQAHYLSLHPNTKVRLEGNTDNRGSREYNVALGWRRDQAVARILEQQGVTPAQLDMISYGKERPAVVGNSQNAWALNRRVNLIYEANS